jgi:hypothetical protein
MINNTDLCSENHTTERGAALENLVCLGMMPGAEYFAWLPSRPHNQADGGPHCCFLDDRQLAWRHLLHLRGGLSTALVSAQLDGESVAECADPPIEAEVSDGGTSSGLGHGRVGCSHWANAAVDPPRGFGFGPIRRVYSRRAPS